MAVAAHSGTGRSHWSFTKPDPSFAVLGHVLLTFRVRRDEDGFYVGDCEPLGVSSFGNTIEEALDATLEATAAYLEALDDSGERERVFAEKGITFSREIPEDWIETKVIAHPGELVSPQRLSELVDA